MKITADCLTTYLAVHDSGPRMPGLVRYIVLHSTEGDTAKGAARYFEDWQSTGSSNLIVDDLECYRVLDDRQIPWGAPPLNTSGFHIEQAGYAAWTRSEWLAHRPTIARAAYKASLRCRRFEIPARVLTVPLLLHDFGQHEPHGGIVTHATISAAFHQSTHTDPGDNYPLDLFMDLLEAHLTAKPV